MSSSLWTNFKIMPSPYGVVYLFSNPGERVDKETGFKRTTGVYVKYSNGTLYLTTEIGKTIRLTRGTLEQLLDLFPKTTKLRWTRTLNGIQTDIDLEVARMRSILNGEKKETISQTLKSYLLPKYVRERQSNRLTRKHLGQLMIGIDEPYSY